MISSCSFLQTGFFQIFKLQTKGEKKTPKPEL